MSTNKQGMEIGGICFKRIDFKHYISGPLANDPSYIDSPIRKDVYFANPILVQDTVVTVDQYFKYLTDVRGEDNPEIEFWQGDWKRGLKFSQANSQGGYKPIVGVSYYDCHAFIEWINSCHQIKCRLLTEAEFEYIAKADCDCVGFCKQAASFGEDCFRQNDLDILFSRDTKLGQPNIFGIYDMLGLIWQWCEDWYDISSDPVLNGNVINKTMPIEPINWNKVIYKRGGKVIRGGSFSYSKNYSSCTNRHFSYPTDRNNNLGFRLAIDL